METIKVKKNEHPELIFHVDVSGTSDPITEVRLTVYDEKKVSYIGKYRDGKAHFRVDEIERYFKTGTFKYELEVFIGSQYFVPLAGDLEVSEGVKIIAEYPERIDETPKIKAQFEMKKGLNPEPIVKATVVKEKEKKVEPKRKQTSFKLSKANKDNKIAYIIKVR